MFVARLALWLGALRASQAAFSTADADKMYTDFNNNLLVTSDGTYYRDAINNPAVPDGWKLALDIQGPIDAFERTGDHDKQNLINDLLTTFLDKNPRPWNPNTWNDDIGWFTLALIRGYHATRNGAFLDAAKYGFDLAYGRSWDESSNGGGIWERDISQMDPSLGSWKAQDTGKEALSNIPLGKVSCYLYQSTHDLNYLSKCTQIYKWVRTNLLTADGVVMRGVYDDGTSMGGGLAYNQGGFIGFAHLVWMVNGDPSTVDDAILAINTGRSQLTENGIFANHDLAGFTWADEFARGLSSFVRSHRLWDTYLPWMLQNAEAILQNNRPDRQITNNGWNTPTSLDDSQHGAAFVGAMSWLQVIPPSTPSPVEGVHIIQNVGNGLVLDSFGTFANGANIKQFSGNWGMNQRWELAQNSDGTWNIMNLATWLAVDCDRGSNQEGLLMVQWTSDRGINQRWWIDQLPEGSYKITSAVSGKVLDFYGNQDNEAALIQSTWNNAPSQQWNFI
jgi:predicted alpha-1,6-mannanase (GH76 family)